MLKKLRANNLDLVIILILAFVLIMLLPDVGSMFQSETKPPKEDVTEDKVKITLEEENKILRAIGNSYIYLDTSVEITDEEILNKDYEDLEYAIMHLEDVTVLESIYVVTVQALFKYEDIYYYDKDLIFRAGLLKSDYDFNSNLFKEVEGLWEYVYHIDKETFKVLSFKVNK